MLEFVAGMEVMANRFSVIVTTMKKKPYDYLDQRKMEFDADFDEFKRQISELHVSIVSSKSYADFTMYRIGYIEK